MSSLAYVFFNKHRAPTSANAMALTDKAFLSLFSLSHPLSPETVALADAREQANLMRFLSSRRR